MKLNKSVSKVLLLVLLLSSFFDSVFFRIPKKLVVFTCLILFFLLRAKAMIKIKKMYFDRQLLWYVSFVFISCISSAFFRNQTNILTNFFECYIYINIVFYYFLYYQKIRAKDCERALLYLCIIFCVLYILQYLVWPVAIFKGALDEINVNDEQKRIRMACSMLATISYFFGINSFLVTKCKTKLVYSVLGFIPIILVGFRSQTVMLLILTFVMILNVSKIKQSFIYVACGLFILYMISDIPFVSDKIQEMLGRQESDSTFLNEDYIRYQEFDYYTSHFANFKEWLFGSGIPVYGTPYFSYIMKSYDQNLYWNDWGIIGLSWMIGIISVLLLVSIIVRALFIKVEKSKLYLKYTLILSLLISIATSAELFRPGNLLIVGIIIYLLENFKMEKYDS